MELDDLKRIWNRLDTVQSPKVYSQDEISSFRKARSNDFSKWIRTTLGMDIFLKAIVSIACLIVLFLFISQFLVAIVAGVVIIVATLLVTIEYKARQKTNQIDQLDGTVQEILSSKVVFMRSMYYRIQFYQSLTNPMLVGTGALVYYYITYREVPPLDTIDILVLTGMLFISFLLTLPSTLTMYGFHLRTLQGCLNSFDDADGWEKEMNRYKKQRRNMSFVIGLLLILGIGLLVLVILI